jgi:hypothetical protein
MQDRLRQVPSWLLFHSNYRSGYGNSPRISNQVEISSIGRFTFRCATLCSDRWYSCSTYDRQQFDQKYPGHPLKELLRFGEPNWADREKRTNQRDFSHDMLDKRLR